MTLSQVFLVVLLVGTTFHNCQGATKVHTLRTYQTPTQYLKGRDGNAVECSSGRSGALELHILEPGLTSKRDQTSFRSADSSRYYLKTTEYAGVSLLRYDGRPTFNGFASFATRKNKFFTGTTSYESLSFRGFYLMCYSGSLVVNRVYDQDGRRAASFIADEEVESGDDGNWTPCTKPCGGGRQTSKDQSCLSVFFCASPSTRKCNTHPCPDPCNPSPCVNGWCSDLGNEFSCNCFQGFTGEFCELSPSTPCSPSPCQNGGTCRPRSRGRYTCTCPSGFTGTNCETASDPCQSKPCQNGGSCARQGTGYTCTCRTGFTGTNCQTASDPCRPNPCQNGGTCARRGAGYTCTCRPRFTGTNCQTAIDPCVPNPCENGGTCTGQGSSYICTCRPGFTGNRCQTTIKNPCAPNPCENGGTCNRQGSSYTCTCRSGFTGKRCQTSSGGGGACQPNPCRNGATCVEGPEGRVCECKLGYHGPTCAKTLGMNVWSDCTKTCGTGTRYRATNCASNSVQTCPREYADCSENGCPPRSCPNGSFRYGSGRSICCAKSIGSACSSVPSTRVTPRIFGGVKSDRGQWPWMAGLVRTTPAPRLFFCGGIVLNKDFVLTAAHCVGLADIAHIEIIIGANSLSSPESGSRRMGVSKEIVHPDFVSPKNDLGLYKLKSSLTFSNVIKPICLPNGDVTPIDLMCFVAGWGVANAANIASLKTEDELQHVGVRKLPLDACVVGFSTTPLKDAVTDKILCAGLLGGGKDTCTGDSGGALVCQRKDSCDWYVAGVTSFGPEECAIGRIPGAYVDVVQYETWIKAKLAEG